MSSVLGITVLTTAMATMTVVGPGVLAPADALVLERVEVRRVLNGWGLEEFASPDVARVAVDDCDLLGYHGVVVVEEMRVFPVYVVDCSQKEHEPLSARGLVADIAPQWGLGHREAVLVLWKSPES